MRINKPIHAQRLEKWLGADRVEDLSKNFKDWYGPPVTLLDVPGHVRVHKGGDFTGPFERGVFYSAYDSLWDNLKRLARRAGSARLYEPDTCYTGFASISDALAKMSGGKAQLPAGGNIQKVGTASGAVGGSVSLWYVGNNPAAGAAGAAAPGGTIPTSASTGAMAFANPSGSDTTHLVGADMMSNVAAMSVMLYDRLFSVTKTMASVATEAVTGVPTRYQSSTASAADYIGGNFLTIECRSALAATAHNWTVCQYTDDAGNTGQTLPSVTGITSCAANRIDISTGWFAPLATGDVGIKALTQMQCSASLGSGAIDFTIGHPIGVMAFPLANFIYPYDWLTNRNLAPRVFDSACLALLQLPQSASSATTFTGNIYLAQG